jgi:hypothetical protein
MHDSLPFNPVLSGSTIASVTTPSSTLSAYRLPLCPPKMAFPSNERSSPLVKASDGSARNRIWFHQSIGLDQGKERTPDLSPGSSDLAHAPMTKASLTDTTKTRPADFSFGEDM